MKPRRSVVTGILLILASGLMLLFIFGMSTLSGGAFPDGGAEWWAAVLGTMFRSPDPAVITYGCLLALAFGIYLCVRPVGVRLTVRRMMAWVGVFAVILAVFVWSASQEHIVMIAKTKGPGGRTVITERYANFFGFTRQVERVEPQ